MGNFVTFEIAKKLKEKGFREECLCHYIGEDLVYNIESPIANNQLWFCHNKFDNIWHRDYVDAPTISQVLKWLREQEISVEPLSTPYNDWKCHVKHSCDLLLNLYLWNIKHISVWNVHALVLSCDLLLNLYLWNIKHIFYMELELSATVVICF